MKQTELFGLFEDGISREKLKKIEMRKDALMILKVKQKYDLIAKRLTPPNEEKNNPYIRLRDGRNLFDLEDYEIENIIYIYELKFQELDYIRLKNLSFLPELCKLEIKFSNIWLPDLKPEIFQKNFFSNLQSLDLSFNNLNNEILLYIKSIKSLKYLNLMGNQITHELPDISDLVNLEELNLSSNNIVSYFLNLYVVTNNSEHSVTNNTQSNNFNMLLNTREILDKKKKLLTTNNFNESKTKTENLTISDNNLKVLGMTKNSVKNLNNVESVNFMNSTVNNNDDSNQQNSINERLLKDSNENKNEINQNNIENEENQLETYEEWQKFLRTNLQEFYHKLSALKNLRMLNLSHNKIHFFDIDPYYIQQINGFSKLNSIDISFNLIDEEISILLVMNIPNLKSIDITSNPITKKKTAYENIEYEIFKTKNILLINTKVNLFSVYEVPNKINFNRMKKNTKEDETKYYKVNDLKIEPTNIFNSKIKSKINKMLERRKKMDEEIIRNDIPECVIDILDNNPHDLLNDILNDDKDERSSIKSILKAKKNKENVFLTNAEIQTNKFSNNKSYEGNEGSENYNKFLGLANKCFGKEKHYKISMPISKAYQKLRFILNNLPTSV